MTNRDVKIPVIAHFIALPCFYDPMISWQKSCTSLRIEVGMRYPAQVFYLLKNTLVPRRPENAPAMNTGAVTPTSGAQQRRTRPAATERSDAEAGAHPGTETETDAGAGAIQFKGGRAVSVLSFEF